MRRRNMPRVVGMRRQRSRCAALDMNAKRCGHIAKYSQHYHGDNEIYDSFGTRPRWVLVKVCEEHRLDT